MNKKTFFGVVTVLIMASCHQTSSNVPESTIAINVRNGSNPIEIQLPEIVDSVHYLALQTSDDCLLGFIQDVRRDSNFYVVKDGHELFAFNEKGEFLNRIGRRGSGPGEYINFDAFYLDRVKNLVYIVSNYQKEILCYSYSGAYCFSIELPHDDGISSVTLCETGEWLAYHRLLNSDTDDIPQYSVMQDMKNGSLVTTPLLPAIGIMARNSFISAQGRPIAHFQGQYYLISAFSNKIYEYENGQISSVYYVDSPNIAPSQSFLEEYKGCELYDFYKILGEKKIGFGLMDVDASSECLFF
ncbi:MAG: 6-bladed beta-propeller, partial [Mediterranea sp.]|nr:6-bladed beta-propeller [Mediterranea sp.]